MLQSYLKGAFRNLIKQKGFSLLNLGGLTIGIAACMLILLYVSFEMSYDQFHEKGDRIHRLRLDESRDSENSIGRVKIYGFIAPDLTEKFPEVESAARLINMHGIMGNFVMGRGDISFSVEKMYYADPELLTIFSFDMLEGNPETALVEPNSAVMTKSTARKFFGDAPALGQTIVQNGETSYQITGVIQDIPENSHIKFDYLLSYESLKSIRFYQHMAEWADWYTYVLLRPEVNTDNFNQKLQAANLIAEHFGERRQSEAVSQLSLQPLPEIHLNSHLEGELEINGSAVLTYSLLIVAFLILLIAWINYINLSTARSLDRAKEVGVRKVVGANRGSLIGQFLLESMLLNIVAFILAAVLVAALLPNFNQLVGKTITMSTYGRSELWGILLACFAFGSLLSSFYPAFVLSEFRPIAILKGNLNFAGGSGSALLRKGLVVFQFAASIALIAGTWAVYQQLSFMRSQELGINIDQTLIVRGPASVEGDYMPLFNSFKTSIGQQSAVKSVTASSNIPGRESTWGGGVRRQDGEPGAVTNYDFMGIDYDFLDAYDMKMVAGRNFSRDFPSDVSGVLLNEAALPHLNAQSPEAIIGEKLLGWRNREYTVLGVVANHHQLSLHQAHLPTVYFLRENGNFYSIKLSSKDIAGTVAAIQSEFDQQFAGNPFDYFFLDTYFDRQYQSDQRFGRVFSLFSGLAILIACLGLFALSSYMAMKRTKEIGIRKVLGASVPDIISLLSRDFLFLIAVANIIALPFARYLIQKWLENYAFRIAMGWELFAIPVIIVAGIAVVTVGFQALKSALANPADALRYE